MGIQHLDEIPGQRAVIDRQNRLASGHQPGYPLGPKLSQVAVERWARRSPTWWSK
jgi:hypothetical protein